MQKATDWLTECGRIMGFTTLESRNSDRLDFREVGVAAAKRALESAYQAGRSGLFAELREHARKQD